MNLSLPDNLIATLLGILLRVGVAFLIIVAGRWLAHATRRWLAQVLTRATLTPSMETLFLTVAYYSVLILAIMLALIFLGVPAATVVALAGLVLIVLGVALQQSLRDLAAAVNFLLFKPFVVGDLIETKGITGVVEEIQLFNTVLVRWDNKVVILPNAEIQQAGITNYAKKQVLRTDLVFGISYGDDIALARQVILELLANDPRVLPEPAPQILVTELGDSSVNLAVRAAVSLENYWALQNELREQVKLRFDQVGITIPFPQRVLHLVAEDETAPAAALPAAAPGD